MVDDGQVGEGDDGRRLVLPIERGVADDVVPLLLKPTREAERKKRRCSLQAAQGQDISIVRDVDELVLLAIADVHVAERNEPVHVVLLSMLNLRDTPPLHSVVGRFGRLLGTDPQVDGRRSGRPRSERVARHAHSVCRLELVVRAPLERVDEIVSLAHFPEVSLGTHNRVHHDGASPQNEEQEERKQQDVDNDDENQSAVLLLLLLGGHLLRLASSELSLLPGPVRAPLE